MIEAVLRPSKERSQVFVELLASLFEQHNVDWVEAFGKRCRPSDLGRRVGSRAFTVNWRRGVVSWVSPSGRGLTLVVTEEVSEPGFEEDLVLGVARNLPLIYARSMEFDYELDQNITDPEILRRRGLMNEKVVLVDSGAPPPLNSKRVDISRNPGRRLWRDGYVEGIGEVMWIGSAFGEVVGELAWSSLEETPWLDVERQPDVTRITHLDGPFVSAENAERQERLRAMVFSAKAEALQ